MTLRAALIATVFGVTCCSDGPLLPTPNDLGLLAPTQDVAILRSVPDAAHSVLWLEVDPGQCFDLTTGVPIPGALVQVDERQLFRLDTNGRMARAPVDDFQAGRRVRIWAHPDGCDILSAAALLP